MFGKKKKSKKEAVAVSTPAPASKGKGNKKKKDGMHLILSESVLETVLDDFRSNTPFVANRDGEDVYVGLYLEAADIGGINKKSKKDEAKGAMVECINSRRIKVLITADLLDKEAMIIIPDNDTLDAMDEFMLLNSAPYKIAFIAKSGELAVSDKSITYDEAVNIIADDQPINDFLISKGLDFEQSPSEDVVEDYDDEEYDNDAYEPYTDDSTPFEDDVMSEDEYEEFVDEDELYEGDASVSEHVDSDDIRSHMAVDTTPSAYAVDEMADEDDAYDYDDETEEVVDEDDSEEPVIIGDVDINQAITRKFYSDDLGLEVTTDAFDAQFIHNNEYYGFDEDRGDGWLNGYVSQIAKDANLELKRLHKDNLLQARSLYYNLLSKHVEEIQKEVDTNNVDGDFGKLYSAMLDRKYADESDIEAKTAQRTKELRDQFEANLEQVGIDAATTAKAQYKARFGPKNEDAIYRVEQELMAGLDIKYNAELKMIHDERKSTALKSLDLGITATLEQVSEVYREALKGEQEAYAAHRDAITRFLDENRKEDIAHDEVLARHLADSKAIEEARTDYATRLAEKQDEYKALVLRHEAEIKELSRSRDEQIAINKATSDLRNTELQAQIEAGKVERAELMAQFKEFERNKEAERKADREEALLRSQEQMQSQKRSNTLMVSLSVVIAIAALAIGCVFGMNFNMGAVVDGSKDAIVERFDKHMNDIEDENTSDTDTDKAPEENAD